MVNLQRHIRCHQMLEFAIKDMWHEVEPIDQARHRRVTAQFRRCHNAPTTLIIGVRVLQLADVAVCAVNFVRQPAVISICPLHREGEKHIIYTKH